MSLCPRTQRGTGPEREARNRLTFSPLLVPPDVPGPVGLPFSGENLTNDSCKLTWYSPEDNGGSAITNYIIEKRESDRMGWTSVSYTVTRNNAVVQGLLDGKGYFFRIAAENIIGMGPFIETDKMVLIKDPICKSERTRAPPVGPVEAPVDPPGTTAVLLGGGAAVLGAELSLVIDSLSCVAVPERPEDLVISAVTKNSISVAWRPPKYDGGAEVTQYVLESRTIGRDNFVRVGGETKLMERTFSLAGLKEGSSHEFRVSAVNQVGQGKPSFATKPVQCKDELGERQPPAGATPRPLPPPPAEQQVHNTPLMFPQNPPRLSWTSVRSCW